MAKRGKTIDLRQMTRRERDRANLKPPMDVPEQVILRESFFGLRHAYQEGMVLCGQVPDGAKWSVNPKGWVSCPACVQVLREQSAPQVDDGDA